MKKFCKKNTALTRGFIFFQDFSPNPRKLQEHRRKPLYNLLYQASEKPQIILAEQLPLFPLLPNRSASTTHAALPLLRALTNLHHSKDCCHVSRNIQVPLTKKNLPPTTDIASLRNITVLKAGLKPQRERIELSDRTKHALQRRIVFHNVSRE